MTISCTIPAMGIHFLMWITYTLYAQAHVKGQEALQTV